MRLQIKVAIAAVMAVLAVSFGVWVHSLTSENKRLTEANAALQTEVQAARDLRLVDQKVAKLYADRNAALTKSKASANAKLTEARAANAAWSDSAVPPGVADALGVPSPTPPK